MPPGPVGLRLTQLPVLASILLTALPTRAEPRDGSRPQPVASYRLRARLDPDRHRVDAEGSITFTNASRSAVTELWFHLYPNAFSNPGTRFFRTASAARRLRRTELHRSGRLEIATLLLDGSEGTNLWAHADPTTPGDPDDTTDRRVPLDHPLQPGATLVLNVRFTTELPFMVERMGWVEDFHAITQWFPKLARLEPDGTWRHFPYEALAEFYADFGNYEITVDVPESFEVAAPGESSRANLGGGRKVIQYQLQGAHDFAWFAWPRFVKSQCSIAGTQVMVYSPPGHERNVQLELDELRWSLPRFQGLFGNYPYARLVVVHPPDVAIPAGGMEYPGLIVTGGVWYLPLTGSRVLNAVTLHELAHQWFYGLIATDEARYPALDEGLASWVELDALTEEYGTRSAYSRFGITVSARAIAEWMGTVGYENGPLSRPASTFKSFANLTHTVYARMALLLQTLSNVYGQEKFKQALHRYSTEQRFEHPTPDALASAIAAEMGRDAAGTFERALNSDGWVDFEPTHLSSRAIAHDLWKTTARVLRRGTLSLPVDLEFTFANGRTLDRSCDATDADCAIEIESNSPVTSLVVDPHRKIAIESRCSNNAIRNTPPLKPLNLLERMTYFLQLLVGGAMP
jgi:hypothetical protein